MYNEVDNWNRVTAPRRSGPKVYRQQSYYVRVKFDVAWAKEGSERAADNQYSIQACGDEFQTVAGMFGEDWVYNEAGIAIRNS